MAELNEAPMSPKAGPPPLVPPDPEEEEEEEEPLCGSINPSRRPRRLQQRSLVPWFIYSIILVYFGGVFESFSVVVVALFVSLGSWVGFQPTINNNALISLWG